MSQLPGSSFCRQRQRGMSRLHRGCLLPPPLKQATLSGGIGNPNEIPCDAGERGRGQHHPHEHLQACTRGTVSRHYPISELIPGHLLPAFLIHPQVPKEAFIIMSPFWTTSSNMDMFAVLLDRHIQVG